MKRQSTEILLDLYDLYFEYDGEDLHVDVIDANTTVSRGFLDEEELDDLLDLVLEARFGDLDCDDLYEVLAEMRAEVS